MAAPKQSELVLSPDAHLRRQLFGDQVLAHPAKQSLPQLIHLLDRFAVPGGLLLDCFGGSGSAMLATSPQWGGMYVVTMELAPHFLDLQQGAWAHFQRTMAYQAHRARWGNISAGDYLPLHGDSRQLQSVLSHAAEVMDAAWDGADLIVTSPSYGGSEAVDQRKAQNKTIARHGGGNTAKLRYDAAEMARNGDIPLIPRQGAEYRTHGLSRHSQLSARMPGYTDEGGYKHIDGHHGGSLWRLNYSGATMTDGHDEIFDLVVTSPPYADALSSQSGIDTTKIKKRGGRHNQSAIGSSYDADLVITSPPYEATLNFEHAERASLFETGEHVTKSGFKVMDERAKSRMRYVSGYDTNARNIGNERGNAYLASMRQVWAGCYWALKPGGILCCITRDCVRDGKRIPIGEQNRALLELAGFRFLEVETWTIPNLSFWRTLQKRRHPDHPVIEDEQVWIMQKPDRLEGVA